jgi:hypothetical protein
MASLGIKQYTCLSLEHFSLRQLCLGINSKSTISKIMLVLRSWNGLSFWAHDR